MKNFLILIMLMISGLSFHPGVLNASEDDSPDCLAPDSTHQKRNVTVSLEPVEKINPINPDSVRYRIKDYAVSPSHGYQQTDDELVAIGSGGNAIKVAKNLSYYKTNLAETPLLHGLKPSVLLSKPYIGNSNQVFAVNKNGVTLYKWPKANFFPFTLLDYIDSLKKQSAGEPFLPLTFDLDITEDCSDNCIFCFSKRFRDLRKKNNDDRPVYMELSDIKRILKDFASMGTRHVRFVSAGEPLQHPHIVEILRYAKEQGLTVTLFTNGNYLIREDIQQTIARSVDLLRVSLDAGTFEQRLKMHRPSFQIDVSDILASLMKIRNLSSQYNHEIIIGTHYIVHRVNFKGVKSLTESSAVDLFDYYFFGHAFGCVGAGFSALNEEESASLCDDLYKLAGVIGPQRSLHINLPLKKALFSTYYLKEHMQREENPQTAWDNCYTYYHMPIIEANGGMKGCTILRGDDSPESPVIFRPQAGIPSLEAEYFKNFSTDLSTHNKYDFCADCCSYPINSAFDNTYKLLKEDPDTQFYLLYYTPEKNNNLPPDYSPILMEDFDSQKLNTAA